MVKAPKTTKATAKGKAQKPSTRGSKANSTAHRAKPAQCYGLKEVQLDVRRMLTTPPAHVDEVLPGFQRGTVGAVVAPGGVGKSFFMLQNAVSITVGKDLFGLWGTPEAATSITKGSVWMISAEDGEAVFHKRLHSVATGLKADQFSAVKTGLKVFVPSGFHLTTKTSKGLTLSPWIDVLRQSLISVKIKPRLIVIDTLNKSLGAANENSASHMGMVFSGLSEIAATFGVSILVVHHASRVANANNVTPDKIASRGSTAVVDSCRWVLNMTKWETGDDDQPGGIGVMTMVTKCNYGEGGVRRELRRGVNGVLTGEFSAYGVSVGSPAPNQSADNNPDSPMSLAS